MWLRKFALCFRKGVETQRDRKFLWTKSTMLQVDAGTSKRSNYAHHKATMRRRGSRPHPLLADNTTLENFANAPCVLVAFIESDPYRFE
ncbi:hypothetical protein WK62_18570 [Burkholderia ubonensis]|nr:hypothetical protein WK62_18570 [Burkholderia ubonensis]